MADVVALGVGVAASGAVVLAFFSGFLFGRNGVYRRLEDDTQHRREILEQLAKVEGVRLVGFE